MAARGARSGAAEDGLGSAAGKRKGKQPAAGADAAREASARADVAPCSPGPGPASGELLGGRKTASAVNEASRTHARRVPHDGRGHHTGDMQSSRRRACREPGLARWVLVSVPGRAAARRSPRAGAGGARGAITC